MSSFATPSPHSPRPFFKRPAYPSFKVGRVGKLYVSTLLSNEQSLTKTAISQPWLSSQPVRPTLHVCPTQLTRSGFGIANYLNEFQAQQARYQLQEEERIRQNQKLMDAYGDKDSLHDVQHALEVYEIQ
jgi:hypothetical protein